MPVYEEKIKDKDTGKLIPKIIDRQKVYYIRTYVVDEFGTRKQITRHNKDWIGREGKKEAEWEEKKIQNKKFVKYENITVNELCDNYLEYIKKIVKLSSFKKINDNIRLYIKPYFKNAKIKDLTTKDILEWHKMLDKEDYSIGFKQNIHGTLVTVLNHGCKFYNVENNVASIAGNFRKISAEKKEMNYLTNDEFNSFIKQEENEIYKCFFTILFYSGMRRGELWCLKWSDIDWEEKIINISKSYNPKNEAVTTTKTKKSNRTISMISKVFKSLKSLEKYKNEDDIFLTKITRTTLQRKCANNCKKANINKKIRIHDFRHSFATMCINQNIPIQIISNYLGHENISTTLDIYGHLYPNSQNKLVNIINDYLTKQDQKQDQEK